MSGKNLSLYNKVFQSIIEIMNTEKIKYNSQGDIIMCVFETHLLNGILNYF